MGQYQRGDVILAPVALDERSGVKTRPAVVIDCGETGVLRVCPVSSKPPSDAPCVPITLDDFSDGGLDLFGESYVMTSQVLSLQSRIVIGRKGRLTTEALADIAGRVTTALQHNSMPARRQGRSRNVH